MMYRMKKWTAQILGGRKLPKSIQAFDPQKSSLILLPPFDRAGGLMTDLGRMLGHHNVFICSNFQEIEVQVKQVVKKIKTQKTLGIVSYGRSSLLALNLVEQIEALNITCKVILIDGVLDEEATFSTDRQLIPPGEEIQHYVEQTAKNNTWSKSLSRERIKDLTPINIQPSTISKVLSTAVQADVYAFTSLGGVQVSEVDFNFITQGKVYQFPLVGHHFEQMKDYLIKDLSFFISNVMKGRHNLLVFTLSTQAAAPNWLKDLENRPMGEGKAPESCKEDVAFEMKQCPYAGSRKKHEKPMNVSALKQMRGVWDDSISLIRLLRDTYLKAHPEVKGQLQLIDIWKITLMASYLPAFLIYRQEGRMMNHCIPPVVASVYKMFIGLKAPVERMIRDEFLGLAHYEKLTASSIHDYAEMNKSFIGPKEVCGGPENLILEFLEAFMDLDQPVQPLAIMEKILPETNDFLDFVHPLINLQLFQTIRFQQTQFLVKSYIEPCTNDKLIADLKQAFHLTENALEQEKHNEIITKLENGIEEKEAYRIQRLKQEELTELSKIEKKNTEINDDFYQNVRLLEEQLLRSCGLHNSVHVNASIHQQYMGEKSFADYINP